MEILCFFAGVAFFYTKSIYPLCFIGVTLLFNRPTPVMLWSMSALLWCTFHQFYVSEQAMSSTRIISKAIVQGYVSSIPVSSASKTQFQFVVTRLNDHPARAHVLMSCFNACPNFQVGEYWQLTAKLKKPLNLANPGGFDYVTWLQTRHIDWTGYVLHHSALLMAKKNIYSKLLVLRQYLASTLVELSFDTTSQGIVEALALGITTHIDKSSWDLFRRTGTTHLMVISGAHIGLVAGLIYGFVKWLWCRSGRLCLHLPAPKIASFFAIMIAGVYSVLAGFAVPAQRALIMCFFMFLPNFVNQRFNVWQAFRYALFAVLLIEPHSVRMPGFYLSFIAVAILVLVNQRFVQKGFKKIVMMQIACLVGLMPLTLFFFSYGSLNGLLANVIAIPWVSFIIVPLSLIITLFGHWFVLPASATILSGSIQFLLSYLTWVDSLSFINLNFSVSQLLSPLAIMVSIGVLAFMPIARFIPAVLVLCLAACFPAVEKIKNGEARLDVLDVGQGLSIVVRTSQHVLVYDTGVQFYQGSDMGKLAIIPYLQTLNVKQLDKVVISHPDLDHRGGLASLEARYRIHELIVDKPSAYGRGVSCHEYPDWTWDGIKFHFFSNPTLVTTKNNSSCVLQISNIKGRVLLTGDIEKQAEDYLIQTYDKKLSSQVLVVPHHGSKTSSTGSFLKKVSPRYAVVSYGFDNRYRFPHQEVMQRYKSQGIAVYDTVLCGMTSVFLRNKKEILQPICYRK